MQYCKNNNPILNKKFTILSLDGTIFHILNKEGERMKKRVRTRLHVLMGEKKIRSINQLSELTGITRQTLTRIYNEEAERLDFATISTLCEFFECEVGDLLYLEDVEEGKEE
jgi:putative transcriptional regulator